MRKTISNMYFTTTAILLVAGITVMGFVQMYLAISYFVNERKSALSGVVQVAAKQVSLLQPDEDLPQLSEENWERMQRALSIVSETSDSSLLLADDQGNVILAAGFDRALGAQIPQTVLDQMAGGQNAMFVSGTLDGVYDKGQYIAGCALTDASGQVRGYAFASSYASALNGYVADMFSTFILSAGLMLLISSLLSVVFTTRLTLPLRRIELLHCKDRDTMLYAFSSREIQLLPLDLTGTGASGVSVSGDYTDAPTSVMQFLGFNTRRAPFSDAALRQAVSAAADRQALVDSCLLGHGSAAQFPLSPASEEYPTELEAPYSIAALQQLTQEEAGSSGDAANAGNTSSDNASAGMYAGVSVTLLVNEENSFKVSAAQEIAAALSRCGLTVTVDSVPWETYLQRLQDGSFDLYYGECRLTADWDILELVGTEGSLNYGGFSDEDTDILLAACRTASEGQRSKALTALWQDLLEKMPIAPLCFKSDSVLTTTGLVEGLTATETDPFFSLEQWTVHLDTPKAAK